MADATVHTTLLISARNTEDNQLVWQAAVKRGWSVERVRGIRVPELQSGRVVLYIESLFAPAVAQQLDLCLATPSQNWLPELPHEYRLRDVRLTTLGSIQRPDLPLFLKPPNEKSFPAKVYDEVATLLSDYDETTPVLAATPVTWEGEFRCFCLNGRVRTLSPYLRSGQLSKDDGFTATDHELAGAREYAERLLADCRVDAPRAVVIDVGVIAGKGWAVIEANAAWGSGIYGCDPNEVLNVLIHAAERCD
jgi:hypothetical protein